MQSGCPEAFTSLYMHYSPRLYTNILSMVHDRIIAEELVQELFTRIWQKKESPVLAENFNGYLYRTARNLVHDFFRRLRRDQELLERFSAALAMKSDNSATSVYDFEPISLLNNAIEQLPPQQKKVYKLVKENGFTYKKAAESLGISPLTVKEYLVSANKSIRNYLLRSTGSPQEYLLPMLLALASI